MFQVSDDFNIYCLIIIFGSRRIDINKFMTHQLLNLKIGIYQKNYNIMSSLFFTFSLIWTII